MNSFGSAGLNYKFRTLPTVSPLYFGGVDVLAVSPCASCSWCPQVHPMRWPSFSPRKTKSLSACGGSPSRPQLMKWWPSLDSIAPSLGGRKASSLLPTQMVGPRGMRLSSLLARNTPRMHWGSIKTCWVKDTSNSSGAQQLKFSRLVALRYFYPLFV